MTRWLVGFIWCGTVVSGAVVSGSIGYSRGARTYERRPEPTRMVVKVPDKSMEADIIWLQNENDELGKKLEVYRDHEDRDLEAGMVKLRDLKLFNVAEAAMKRVADNLDHPIWLRGSYKVHPRRNHWIVEGMVVESRGYMDAAWTYFWAVEVERAMGNPRAEYQAQRVTWNLNLYEPSPAREGEWVKSGVIRVPENTLYPKLDYGSP